MSKFLKGNKSNINLYTNLFLSLSPPSSSSRKRGRLSTTAIVKTMPATEVEGFFWRLAYGGLPPSLSGTKARIYDRLLKDLCPKFISRYPIRINSCAVPELVEGCASKNPICVKSASSAKSAVQRPLRQSAESAGEKNSVNQLRLRIQKFNLRKNPCHQRNQRF